MVKSLFLKHFIHWKAWSVSGLLVLCVLLIVSPVNAQSAHDVLNRLNRLENEINTLNRAVYKGDTSVNSLSLGGNSTTKANTEIRLQQFDVELRDLRGMLEEQTHAVRQVQNKLNRALSDMELRLSELEGKASGLSSHSSNIGNSVNYTAKSSGAFVPTKVIPQSGSDFNWSSSNNVVSKQPPSVGTLGTLSQHSPSGSYSVSNRDNAASVYEDAFALLKGSKYAAAEKGFQKFINQYPDHILTGNAKYWLGETFYVRGNYDRAVRLFAEGYKQYPTGSKASDNLLKLGMSLVGLGDKENACVAFEQLEKEFSGKSQPVLRRARQESKRIGCN